MTFGSAKNVKNRVKKQPSDLRMGRWLDYRLIHEPNSAEPTAQLHHTQYVIIVEHSDLNDSTELFLRWLARKLPQSFPDEGYLCTNYDIRIWPRLTDFDKKRWDFEGSAGTHPEQSSSQGWLLVDFKSLVQSAKTNWIRQI